MGKIWSGHFWYTKFWVQNPSPPPPLPPSPPLLKRSPGRDPCGEPGKCMRRGKEKTLRVCGGDDGSPDRTPKKPISDVLWHSPGRPVLVAVRCGPLVFLATRASDTRLGPLETPVGRDCFCCLAQACAPHGPMGQGGGVSALDKLFFPSCDLHVLPVVLTSRQPTPHVTAHTSPSGGGGGSTAALGFGLLDYQLHSTDPQLDL